MMTKKLPSVSEKLTKPARRDFLKFVSVASLSAGGLMQADHNRFLGLENLSRVPGSARKLDPEAELRVGMIGTSGHTGLVLDVLQQIKGARLVAYALRDGERTALSDAKTKAAGGFQTELNQVKTHSAVRRDTHFFETYQEMFSKEKLDVVGICLPYTLNAFASMAAAERGIHVMSEKPLATELRSLEQLEQAVKKSGVQISAMLEMRLWPGLRTIRDVISKGLIGEPILATAQKSYKFGNDRPSFYRERETYGGTIPWIGIHAIDYIMHTTGLKVTRVSAFQGNKAHPDYPGTEDHAGILLGLSNGGTAVVTLDYLRPEAADSHGDDRLRVIGSKGVVEMRGEKVELITQDAPSRNLPLLPHLSIFEDFVASLRGQHSHILPAEEIFYVNRICLLARQGADEERVVYV